MKDVKVVKDAKDVGWLNDGKLVKVVKVHPVLQGVTWEM